jgi:hypothetical protein
MSRKKLKGGPMEKERKREKRNQKAKINVFPQQTRICSQSSLGLYSIDSQYGEVARIGNQKPVFEPASTMTLEHCQKSPIFSSQRATQKQPSTEFAPSFSPFQTSIFSFPKVLLKSIFEGMEVEPIDDVVSLKKQLEEEIEKNESLKKECERLRTSNARIVRHILTYIPSTKETVIPKHTG